MNYMGIYHSPTRELTSSEKQLFRCLFGSFIQGIKTSQE